MLLRTREHPEAALAFARSLAAGVHRLECPKVAELELALQLAQRYMDSGADMPDLIVMAMASCRQARILTWDFRHFRAVVLRRGYHWPLLVEEQDLPMP